MNGHCQNKVKVVLGAQWGDEGKGKLVDLLAENANIVARCQVMHFLIFVHYIIFNGVIFNSNIFLPMVYREEIMLDIRLL